MLGSQTRVNNIKDDRALTETPAHYPCSGPGLIPSQTLGPGWDGSWGRRGGQAQSGADLPGFLQSGVLPPGSHQEGDLLLLASVFPPKQSALNFCDLVNVHSNSTHNHPILENCPDVQQKNGCYRLNIYVPFEFTC